MCVWGCEALICCCCLDGVGFRERMSRVRDGDLCIWHGGQSCVCVLWIGQGFGAQL